MRASLSLSSRAPTTTCCSRRCNSSPKPGNLGRVTLFVQQRQPVLFQAYQQHAQDIATVVATVSFAVASAGSGLRNAIQRILLMTQDWNEQTRIATSIIEGHLRDSTGTMTLE